MGSFVSMPRSVRADANESNMSLSVSCKRGDLGVWSQGSVGTAGADEGEVAGASFDGGTSDSGSSALHDSAPAGSSEYAEAVELLRDMPICSL